MHWIKHFVIITQPHTQKQEAHLTMSGFIIGMGIINTGQVEL